jgi:hypothetical protein
VIDTTDLVVGEDLPDAFEATAIEITTDTARKRRAHITLEDGAGHQVLFVDYEGAELDVDWQQGTRYRITDCPVQHGDQHHRVTLAPGKRADVTAVDVTDEAATLIILGDTYVGRTRHPGNGSRIDPTTDFQNAITIARALEVDAVVHTGDIFHDDGVSQTELDAVEEGVFAQLAADEIPFYYVTGNHETRASQRFLREQTAQRDLVTNLTTTGVNIGGPYSSVASTAAAMEPSTRAHTISRRSQRSGGCSCSTTPFVNYSQDISRTPNPGGRLTLTTSHSVVPAASTCSSLATITVPNEHRWKTLRQCTSGQRSR